MGTVYRAIDRSTREAVAIKVLHRHRTHHADRFAREVKLLNELNHPGIVRCVWSGVTASGEPFFAMEWLDGETLAARLERGRLAVDEAVDLVRRVAAALEIA